MNDESEPIIANPVTPDVIKWLCKRTMDLAFKGCSPEEAKAILREESKSRPWETAEVWL